MVMNCKRLVLAVLILLQIDPAYCGAATTEAGYNSSWGRNEHPEGVPGLHRSSPS